MVCTTELNLTIIEIYIYIYIYHLSSMCVLNALRGDSKLEMGDGKRPLDVRGGGDQRPGC